MIENNRYQTIDPHHFGFQLKFNIGHAVTGWQGVKSWITKKLKIFITNDQAKNLSKEIREYTSLKGPFLENNQLEEFIFNWLELKKFKDLKLNLINRDETNDY